MKLEEALKIGYKVTRASWQDLYGVKSDDDKMWINVVMGRESCKELQFVDGEQFHPYPNDLFADDWYPAPITIQITSDDFWDAVKKFWKEKHAAQGYVHDERQAALNDEYIADCFKKLYDKLGFKNET